MSDPKEIIGIVQDGVVILVGTDHEYWGDRHAGSRTATEHIILGMDIGSRSAFEGIDADDRATATYLRDAMDEVRKHLLKDFADIFGVRPDLQRGGGAFRFQKLTKEEVMRQAAGNARRVFRRWPKVGRT